MENNMEKGYIKMKKENIVEDDGKLAKELNGYQLKNVLRN